MSDKSNKPESTDRIATEAAAWVLRQDRGLSAEEQDALSEWLSADTRHGDALRRHRRQWARLDVLADWRPEHGDAPNPDLLTVQAQRPWWQSHWAAWSFAAAAAIALLLTLPPLFRNFHVDAAQSAAQEPPPENQRHLADGSVVELNVDASISVRYTASERRIVLERGEAHFTVAKDPLHPFIVEVGSYEVRAIGTAFNIRNDARAVEVLVTEGTIGLATHNRVSAPQDGPSTPPQGTKDIASQNGSSPSFTRLDARQRAVLPAAASPGPAAAAPVPPQIATLTPVEIERVLSWQHRLLEFSSQPLADIVAEFNRRNKIQLIIADPELAGMRVSAKLRSDNVKGFVRLLERGFGTRVEQHGDREIVLHHGQ